MLKLEPNRYEVIADNLVCPFLPVNDNHHNNVECCRSIVCPGEGTLQLPVGNLPQNTADKINCTFVQSSIYITVKKNFKLFFF